MFHKKVHLYLYLSFVMYVYKCFTVNNCYSDQKNQSYLSLGVHKMFLDFKNYLMWCSYGLPLFSVINTDTKKWINERKGCFPQGEDVATDGESLWTLASPCPDDAHSDSWKTQWEQQAGRPRLLATLYQFVPNFNQVFLEIRTKFMWSWWQNWHTS